MTMLRTAVLSAIVVLAAAAGPAAAQQAVPDAGGRVYGLVGGGLGAGELVAVGAGAGLRLTRHLGLDVELTHLSGVNDDDHWRSAWFGAVSVFDASPSAEDYPPLGAELASRF